MFNKDNNVTYVRNIGAVEDRINSARYASERAQSQIINDTTPTTGDVFETEAAGQNTDPIYPTDLMPGVHVQNPTFSNVEALDVNKTVTAAPQNPAASRQQHETAVSTYMDMHQTVIADFVGAMKEVDRKAGDFFQKGISMPGGSSILADTMKLATPLEECKDMYSIVNCMLGQHPNSERMKAVASETLTKLQSRTDQQNDLASRAKGPAPIIDWNVCKSSTQIIKLAESNPNNHPFMLLAAQNERIVEQMETNFENYNETYLKGEQKVTTDMMVSARNNASLLSTLARGDDEVVQKIKKGEPEKPRVAETADEVKMFAAAGREISGVKVQMPDITDLDESTKGIFKAAYMPPKPTIPALNADFVMHGA